MRKEVKHYTGNEITDDVIRSISLIEMKRLHEGLIGFFTESVDSLEELCDYHDTLSEQENIILGEDWYITYAIENNELEINEWIAVNKVSNKFVQTMEMFTAMKNILLQNKTSKVFATMRHSTSYKFYTSLLSKGYFKELSNNPILEESPSDLEEIVETIKSKYNSLEEYLKDENKDQFDGVDIEDYIFHNIIFEVTDKFVKRYQKRK